MVCGPRPGKSVRSFLIFSMETPGTTWLCECIMVSMTTVSPDFMCRTGGCALLYQPHCVVSIVAGSSRTLPGLVAAGTDISASSSVDLTGSGGGGLGAWAAKQRYMQQFQASPHRSLPHRLASLVPDRPHEPPCGSRHRRAHGRAM